MEIINGQGHDLQRELDEAHLHFARCQALNMHQRTENQKGLGLLLLLVCVLIALCTPAIIWAVWSWALG